MSDTRIPPDLRPRKVFDDADSAIRAANEEIDRATTSRWELPVPLLVKQRDQALVDACEARAQAERRMLEARQEQDRFVEELMREHEARRVQLEAAHAEQLDELRRQLLALSLANAGPTTEETILREQLADALGSLELARGESRELREELDAAAIAYDDMRQEMWAAVEQARDDAAALQSKVDELVHAMEDEKEAHAAEARQFQSELERLRAEHERIHAAPKEQSAAERPTVPPEVVAARREADIAKQEVHALRLELIDAKRSLSRRSQELQAASSEVERKRRSGQRIPRVGSAERLEQLGAQVAETPAFQRFMRRREQIRGSYSDKGGVDVLTPREEPADDDDG